MDEIYTYIGESGKYQMLVFLALTPFGFYSGLDVASQNILYGEPSHWCKVPYLSNYTPEEQKEMAIPINSGTGEYEECIYYDRQNNTLNSTRISSCHSWYYEDDMFTKTAVTQWNLVCDQSSAVTLAETMVMLSFCVGSFIAGPISDRFGRKSALTIFNLILLVFGFLACFSSSFVMFLILRVIYMASSRAAHTTGLVIVVELFGPGVRTFLSYLYQIWLALGVSLCGAIGYLIRDFITLQYVLLVPAIMSTLYIWKLPESPRYLLAKDKIRKASALLTKIMGFNGRQVPENLETILQDVFVKDIKINKSVTKDSKLSLRVLTQYPNVLKNIGICSANLTINAMIYAAITFNTASLPGDVFMNLIISGVTEAPAHLLAFLGSRKLGRKITVLIAFSTAGICLLATIPLVETSSVPWLVTGLTQVARAADACAGSTTIVLSSELFPTSVRQVSMGMLLACNGAGGLVAPYFNEVLNSVWMSLASLVFGLLALVVAALSMSLPETLNNKLPETLEEANMLGKEDICVRKLGHVNPSFEGDTSRIEKY